MIAGGTSDRRGKQTCFFSAMDPSEKLVPDLQGLSKDEPRIMHYKHSKRPVHDAVSTFDLKIAQDRGLTFDQTGSVAINLYDTTPTKALVRVDPVQLERNNTSCNQVWRHREKTFSNNSDIAQISCVDLRVQGEPDQLMDDEEHEKRSLIQSLLMNVLQSPNKDNLMAQLFLERDGRQGVSKRFLRLQRTWLKNKAMSTLMKSS